MNPEMAYRLHTDWARAVLKPDSPTNGWFQKTLAGHCRPIGLDVAGHGSSFRIFTEPTSFAAMLRTGPTSNTRIVVGYDRHDDDPAAAVPTDVYAAEAPEPAPLSVDAESVLVPEQIYAEATPQALAEAPTYYVTADMCTLIEVAAEAFDDFDLMPRLPAAAGFVVLARPVYLPMPGGTSQPVRAFAWNTWGDIATSMGTPGMVGEVWTFASRRDDAEFKVVAEAAADWPSKKAWATDPDLLPCFADWLVTGIPVGPLSETVAEGNARAEAHQWLRQRGARYQQSPPTPEVWQGLVSAAQARYDQRLAAATKTERTDRYGYWQPYLAAFVLLLTQQITATAAEPVSADEARLASKVGPRRPSTVTVVDIRSTGHTSGDTPDESTGHRRAPLDHRHLVGAHWKWQPYGPNRSLRRRILITPYVRGPEDKPLVVRPRVTRL